MCIFVCGEMRGRKSTRWVYCLTYESPWSWSCHSSKTLRFVRLSMTLGINTKMPGHRTHKVLQIFGHEPGRFVWRAWKFATECHFLFVCTGYFLFFWSCHQQSLCSGHFFASLFLQNLRRKEFWSRLLRNKQSVTWGVKGKQHLQTATSWCTQRMSKKVQNSVPMQSKGSFVAISAACRKNALDRMRKKRC